MMLWGKVILQLFILNTSFIGKQCNLAWTHLGTSCERNHSLERSTCQAPSGLTTSKAMVAKMTQALLLAAHTPTLPLCWKKSNKQTRYSKWLAVHSHRTRKLRRGMCNSISPAVLHQREAHRSISLRHPGCAGLVYAHKILAAQH